MENFKVDDRVKIIGKNISGKIAFIGETHFSEGEWFGIILDEAKGRNNGCIDGKHYFKCPRNYGLFVRSCQLQKKTTQIETNTKSNVKKALYPNYLVNSAFLKSSKHQRKIQPVHKIKASNKTPCIHPMNTVIGDLKSILESKSEEIFNLGSQKREATDKLKSIEREMQCLREELKKNSKRENDFKLEIKIAKNDLELLNRKLSETKNSLQSSEIQRNKLNMTIERLREITEHAIIEKEIAEENCEQHELHMKDEVDKAKALEIELNILKEEMKLQIINGVPAIHYIKKLENENEVLKCAIGRLRDLYENLHEQFLNSKDMVKKYSQEVEDLKSVEKTMENTLCKYQEETSELYEIIESLSNADDVVFEITEQNLKSEEKISHLYGMLNDTENLLEISEETEEALQEIRFICRDHIECLETKIRRIQAALEHKKNSIKELEEVIHKYRKLTSELQEKNHRLTEDFEEVNKDRKKAVLTAESLKLKIHQEERKTISDLIEKENMKFDLESCKNQFNYWLPFMPDNFFDECGENEAIQVKLIASKMMKKLNLLISILQTSSYDVSKPDGLEILSTDTNLLTSIYELYRFISVFIKSADRISSEEFLTLGRYREFLNKEDEKIDSYLVSLAKGDINRKDCAKNIKDMHYSLSCILNTQCATENEKAMIYLTCYLNMIQSNCKCLVSYCMALQDFSNISPEFKCDIKLIMEKSNKIKSNVNSTLNIIRNYENEGVCLMPGVEKRVENNCKTIEETTKYIINKYVALIEEDEFLKSESKDEKLMPLNEVNCKCETADLDLEELCKKISSGEYFVEYTPCSEFASIYDLAQKKKQEKEQIVSELRNKISSYQFDVSSLTKRLQKQKAQINEINKISKIQNVAKKNTSQQTEEQKYCTNDYSLETDFLLLTLKDMKSSMQYLRQKNFELTIAPIKNYPQVLKPLKLLPKTKYHKDTHTIYQLQKRLSNLTVKLKNILLPCVVDITEKTKDPPNNNYTKYLAEKILIKKEIENELWNITIDVKKLKAVSRDVWSHTNPFAF